MYHICYEQCIALLCIEHCFAMNSEWKSVNCIHLAFLLEHFVATLLVPNLHDLVFSSTHHLRGYFILVKRHKSKWLQYYILFSYNKEIKTLDYHKKCEKNNKMNSQLEKWNIRIKSAGILPSSITLLSSCYIKEAL